MGFTDISINGSDRASDFVSSLLCAMLPLFREEMKDEANEYNTSGPVNVALFFEEVICNTDVFYNSEDFIGIANDVINALDEMIKESKTFTDTEWPSKKEHVRRFRQMRNKIKKWVDNY